MTIDQMWERLAAHQPYADQRGYGEAWAQMCAERTPEAAEAAAAAAWAVLATQAWWAAWAAARGATDEATGWIEKAEGRE